MRRSLLSMTFVLALESVVASQSLAPRTLEESGRIFVAAAGGLLESEGGVLEVRGGPPWIVRGPDGAGGGHRLRRFGRYNYLLRQGEGEVVRIGPGGGVRNVIALDPLSQPQDVFVTEGRIAYVTRLFDSRLFRHDLDAGTASDVLDLGVLAGEDETAGLRMMLREGNRLFVQVGFHTSLGASRGALAVVDLASEQLIDADPLTPGVQGIELDGAPPHARMQVLDRTLYVSSTGERLDSRGGIERVDLDTLTAAGYVLTERQAGGVDLGAFVMVTADEGYAVAHTDIVASTHLRHFTVAGGLTPGPDLVTLLGDAVDSLAYDRRRHRLYLPSGFSGFGTTRGIYVLDTRTNRLTRGGPLATATPVHDVLLAR